MNFFSLDLEDSLRSAVANPPGMLMDPRTVKPKERGVGPGGYDPTIREDKVKVKLPDLR